MKNLFKNNKCDFSLYVVEIVLLAIAITLISFKFLKWNYSFQKLIPEVIYEFQLTINYDNVNEPLNISAFLPLNDQRQEILDEYQDYAGLKLNSHYSDNGRKIQWYSSAAENKSGQIIYNASLLNKRMVFALPDSIVILEQYPQNFKRYLEPTETIQSNHPIIVRLYHQLISDSSNTGNIISSIYHYVSSLETLPFKGLTDAVTAAKLEEASCNGKSRLFIALARKAGIPGRLVGGVILNSGTKKASHQWLELYLNGHWVPFDALNGYFAEIPKNYLTMYYGDQFLFSHNPNITFDYNFKIRKKLAIGKTFRNELIQNPFNAYKAWEVFEHLGIPLSLLQIIIMIPLGAFVITIFRNVIGLETFGTFLPALLAAASRETGLLWGMIGFILVVMIVAVMHYPLEKWRILHNPKMSILMIVVVSALLFFTMIGYKIGLNDLSYISIFPIAVLTITSERFSLMIVERGVLKAVKVMFMTLIVISVAYLAMNSLAMQSLFLAFPEIFLILITLNLWIGRWIGLRFIELWRFRWLID